MDILINLSEKTKEWTNLNSGFVTLIIFFVTILFGWVSGIFRALRLKPKLKIKIIEGPSFCSTFPAKDLPDSNCHHRTAISVYLKISNTGSAPTEIDNISVGYKSKAYKNPFSWFWLDTETVCLSDFKVPLGREKKAIPFLRQRNQTMENNTSTYLRVGECCVGLSYFEQEASVCNYYPKDVEFKVKIIVRVKDAFGNYFYSKSIIPKVKLSGAQEWCEKFGQTIEGCNLYKREA